MRPPRIESAPEYDAARRIDRDWSDAASLADLGHKTALWLEGAIPMHPDQPAPPNEETIPLIGRLAAYNRAGLVTLVSQPGLPEQTGFDGATWAQRAAFEAIAHDPVAARVYAAAKQAGMLAQLRGPDSTEDQPATTVTRRDGYTYTTFGTYPPEVIRDTFMPCTRPSLQLELKRAWQVVIIDPQWGRLDVLWNAVDRALFGPDVTTPVTQRSANITLPGA
jgi:hypothetical protein